MVNLFAKLLLISGEAGFLVVMILLVRVLTSRGPKWILPILWGFVGIRLMLPFSIPVTISNTPHIDDLLLNGINNNYLRQHFTVNNDTSSDFMWILCLFWIAGFVGMLCYMIVSYVKISVKVKNAVLIDRQFYTGECIKSPFLFGVIRPRIFIPYSASDKDINNIISHELAHLKRKDNVFKIIAFILLSVHWFNPLIWVAYMMYNRDTELACDEKVIKSMNKIQRVDYAQTLLNYCKNTAVTSFCTLSLGKGNMKKRILDVLNYRKAPICLTGISIASACILLVVSLMVPRMSDISADAHINEDNKFIIFDDFEKDALGQDEYICCIDDTRFKLKLTDGHFSCTFMPETSWEDINKVFGNINAGLKKTYDSLWEEKTVKTKKEAMQRSTMRYEQAVNKYLDTIIIH